MTHFSPVGPVLSLLAGPLEVLINEQRLAADLLILFTGLRSIESVTEDNQILGDGRRISGCPIVSKMPLRLNDRAAIPGLAKLESLYL
jgi:hypothetical protein